MSVWQYMAALDGYSRAHDPDCEDKLSPVEQDELWDWLQSKE